MAATADTEMMRAKGISDSKFSRANDRRRLGFVEGTGRRHHPAGPRRPRAQDGSAGAGGGRPTSRRSATACTRRSRLPGSARWAPVAAARIRSWRARWPSSASAPTTSRWCPSTTPPRWPTIPNETELHERLADSLGRSAGRTAVRGVAEEPDRSREGRRGGVPDDGAVPDPARRRHSAEPQPGLRRRRTRRRRALRLAARHPAAGREVPAEGGSGHQPRVRSRVGSGRAGAPAGVPGRARVPSSGRLQGARRTRGCWRVSAGWRRRSPVGGRCTRGLPTVGSATRRRRSGRRPRCFSTRRRGSATTTCIVRPEV